jgi:hypothetical protein
MADPTVPSVLSFDTGPLSTGERFKKSGWAEEGDQDPYAPAERAHKTAAEKQKALAERFEKRRPQEERESERAYAGAEKAMAQPRPAIPQMERVESPPKPEDYHKMSMGYLGAMVLLGAFGGKFIRNAANAPLAAFNGALTGWQEGNLEAYKEKSAEWKEKQQQVLDNNRARLDEYRTILEDRNASIQDQMLRVKLVAAKHQDKMMYDRADADNWTGVGQAYDQSVAVHEKNVAATDKFVEQQTQVNDTAVERANEWKAALATPQGQQRLAQLEQRSPGAAFRIRSYVKQFADADPAPLAAQQVGPEGTEGPPPAAPGARMPPEFRAPFPPTGTKPAERDAWYFEKGSWEKHGRPPTDQERGERYRLQHPGRTAPAIALQERIEEYQATHDGQAPPAEEIQRYSQEYAAAVSAGRAVGGRLGNILVSAGEVEELAPQAIETSARVPRGKWVKLNQIRLNLMGQASDPDYADFVAANRGLITAYGSTMSRSGANTVSAQNHAEEAINLATSHVAYVRVVKRLQKEVDAVKRAPQHAMEALRQMGIKPEEDGGGGGGEIRYLDGKPYRRGPNGEAVPVRE